MARDLAHAKACSGLARSWPLCAGSKRCCAVCKCSSVVLPVIVPLLYGCTALDASCTEPWLWHPLLTYNNFFDQIRWVCPVRNPFVHAQV